MSETREELKKRIFAKIEKAFENHLDNVVIEDNYEENFFCKKAYIDEGEPQEDCPEPQEMAAYDDVADKCLRIEIHYVVDLK